MNVELKKNEERSNNKRHEFDIFSGKKKTGRAFFHKEGEQWFVTMLERQKINRSKYDDYPMITHLTMQALITKAEELKLPSFSFKARQNDTEDFHEFLRGMEFRQKGDVFEISFKKSLLQRFGLR